jgi:arylsulfatase
MTDDTRPAVQRRDASARNVLPVPDLTHVGTVTYDAKDPDTSFPACHRSGHPQAHPMSC